MTYEKSARYKRAQSVAMACIAALLLTACETIRPLKPEASPGAPLPSVPNSLLTIPVRVNVAALSAEIDSSLSPTEGPAGIYWTSNEGIAHNSTLQLGVHRSGNTSLTTDDGCLVLAVPVAINNGRIDWFQKVGFVKVKKHFEFGGSGNVRARACFRVDQDWQLQVDVLPDFTWIEGAWIDLNPPVGHITIGIAGKVEPKLREKLPAFAAAISEKVSAISLKPVVERAWGAAQRPVPLSTNPPIALEVEPISVGIGPPVSEGAELVIRPAIVAKLQVHAGAGAASSQTKPLPPNTGTLGADGFSLSVRADASFAELNSQARERLVGKAIQLGNQATVTPGGVIISSLGDKVLLRVDFRAKLSRVKVGSLSGWLYLTGRPKYDDAKRQLSIEDVDFDLNTRNLLVDGAEALLHERFIQKLRETLVFDLSGKIDPMRSRVEAGAQGLKVGKGISLNVAVESLSLSDIHIGTDGIGIYATAKGSSNLVVDPNSE